MPNHDFEGQDTTLMSILELPQVNYSMSVDEASQPYIPSIVFLTQVNSSESSGRNLQASEELPQEDLLQQVAE